MIRALYRWWLRRALHDECVMSAICIEYGWRVPFGACSECEPRIRKLRALRMPRARLRA